jgi:hypothetical protein
MLFFNGKKCPSVPISHAVHMTESYENVYNLMKHIQYDEYTWHVYGGLKVITPVLGLQLGCMKLIVSTVNETAEHEKVITQR